MPPNIPPMGVVNHVQTMAPGWLPWFFWQLLDSHRGLDAASVTSWWRSPEHNRSVGGHPDSQHLAALAADLVYPTDADRRRAIAAMRARGLIVVPADRHVHVQAFPAGFARELGILPIWV